MAINGQVQTLPRRGVRLSPLAMALLFVILTAAVVMGVLVGRWSAPSTTGADRAERLAPTQAVVATPGGSTARLGSITRSGAFVPGVTDFPSSGASGHTPFVPWVTDFSS